uniref:Protein MMS22-like n=1 Tax=Glossina palpalis gambiensis TaxID=67801 RepID=A0A1B0BDJ3_9MUSC
MDFNLFDLDEDDILLASTTNSIEPTQATNISDNEILELHCQGPDTLTSQFSEDGFVRNGFLNNYLLENKQIIDDITLTAYKLQWKHIHGSAVCRFLFGEACMNIQHLVASTENPLNTPQNIEYCQKRREVTRLMHLLLRNLQKDQWPLMRTHLIRLRSLINSVTQEDDLKHLYFANSCKGNDCHIPAYHLLHGSMEWKFLDLCLLYKYEWIPNSTYENREEEEAKNSLHDFLNQLERFVEDLAACSVFIFKKKCSAELLFSSPFPCCCFKELWLLVQLSLEKWSLCFLEEHLTFWKLYNRVMENVKKKLDIYSLNSLIYCEFSNWLLNALVRLHGYRSNGLFEGPQYARALTESNENFEFCERITQEFLRNNPQEEQLRVYIALLTPTLLQWWPAKVQIPMLLWEHFHKKLNSSFYVPGGVPSNLAVTCSSGRTYVDKYRALLQKKPDVNLASFTLFNVLLGKLLERLSFSQANHQAQKLLGRIYAKFSAQKFLTLNETGIHHLIELFLLLALNGDFNDLAPKLRDKLLALQFDKITANKQIAVAKGHMALWILHAENRSDMTDYIKKVLQQLNSIGNDLAVSKIIADTLLDIYQLTDDFQLGEHLLIGSWIPNFLSNCLPVEQKLTFEALHLIFTKLQSTEIYLDSGNQLMQALHSFILPFVKQQFLTNSSHFLAQLAADFCICSPINQETQGFRKLFTHFTEAQCINRGTQLNFLLKILVSERKSLVDCSITMQIWLKSLVLLTHSQEEVKELTKIVVQLADYQYITNNGAGDLMEAKEPLYNFIAAIGRNYQESLEDQQKCLRLTHNFNLYIRNFDKWLVSIDSKLEKLDILFRFYSFLAIVIYNCPHMIYVKSKITCFLHIAITRYVLPTTVQMGKAPEGKLAQLVHKVWPVVVQGIGQLNFKTDGYINKTLTDLIQKWTPHFKISPNSKLVARPFIICLQGQNQELSLFVFEKLTTLFLNTQRRQADPYACLVITIFQEIVDAFCQRDDPLNEQRLSLFIKGTCLATLCHIMMVDELVPSRSLLLALFQRLLNCDLFRNSKSLKELFLQQLRTLTKKHLAYYTFFYFDLLMQLSQISPELIADIMDYLLAEIMIVEQKRGVDEDNRIRQCLLKLQQSVKVSKK